MTGRILVGHDGSQNSEAALDAAIDEAEARGAELDVINVWRVPLLVDPYSIRVEMIHTEHAAEASVEAAALRAERRLGRPVGRRIVPGSPRAVLTDEASHYDLVVVGAKGYHAIPGLRLGSVARHLAHSSPVPLLIVPPPSRQPERELRNSATTSTDSASVA